MPPTRKESGAATLAPLFYRVATRNVSSHASGQAGCVWLVVLRLSFSQIELIIPGSTQFFKDGWLTSESDNERKREQKKIKR